MDNEAAKENLKFKLQAGFQQCVENAKQQVEKEYQRKQNAAYREQYGIPDIDSEDEDETSEPVETETEQTETRGSDLDVFSKA